ncbi:MAG: hypothetical protein PWP33_809 [Thermodesulfobacterium sp.]|nr:hypothetical protein [Thermodesulfobacterium sp.]
MKNKAFFIKIVLFLIAFGGALYFPFIGEKEFQGEEGRRVLIALQMLETKEFLFPKLFDTFYFLKPPGYNWFLALWFYLFKDFSEWTARASSAVSLIFTSLVFTWIWIKILKKEEIVEQKNISWVVLGLPGLIFLTTPEVIDKAIRAEIDGFYTFLVSTSLFSWFYFYEIEKRRMVGFVLWGIFTGFAVLTKTFHALLFFYLAWIPYLIYFKRLKELFSIPHFLGIGVTLGIFITWLLVSLGFDITLFKAWLGEYQGAVSGAEVSLTQHFEAFTLGFLIGYAPWIFFFLVLKEKEFFKSFLDKHPNFFRFFLFSLFLFVFSYLFHIFCLGARLRYMLPGVGGLVFVSSTVFLYLILEKQRMISKIGKICIRFLPWFCVFLSLSFLAYLMFKGFYYWEAFLTTILLMSGGIFFGFRFRKEVTYKGVFWFLVFCVFFIKQAYAAFYYSYHKEKFDYFRKAAKNLILTTGKNEVIYLCEETPHHLIYYGKYRYQALDFIYLKNCNPDVVSKLKDRWILISKERFESLGFKEKKFSELRVLPVRKKLYFLVKNY